MLGVDLIVVIKRCQRPFCLILSLTLESSGSYRPQEISQPEFFNEENVVSETKLGNVFSFIFRYIQIKELQ